MVLDKSPENILDNDLMRIKKEFEHNIPNVVLCSEPFHKAEFLNRLIDSYKGQIIFVDMDLLYSGYIESGMIQKKDNVEIFHPNRENWKDKFSEIITKTSSEKFLVIIDSFNGVYNLFEDLNSAKFINSCIMLLSSVGRKTDSSIIITAMARKRDDGEWILSPGGKQIIKSNTTMVRLLKKVQDNLMILPIEDNETNPVYKIECVR